MNIIAGGRGTGRTTEIIKACEADPGSVIVCANSVARRHITGMAQEMGADIPEPVTLYDLMNGAMRGKNVTGYYLDDVDLILEYAILRGVPVRGLSIEGGADNVILLGAKTEG